MGPIDENRSSESNIEIIGSILKSQVLFLKLYRFLSILSIIISFNKWTIYEFFQHFVSPVCKWIHWKYTMHPFAWTRVRRSCRSLGVLMTGEMIVLLIEAKGYHECPFTVRTGEHFVLDKKIGDRGEVMDGSVGYAWTQSYGIVINVYD